LTVVTEIPNTEPEKLQARINVSNSSEDESYARFIIEPLSQGFGVTLGNSLRRVMLNSLPGLAITSARIEGVQHEYSILKHVQEDMVDFLLNVKGIRLKSISGRPGILRLEVKGRSGLVTAGDIEPNGEVEIVNPDQPLMNLDNDKAKVSVEFTYSGGTGFAGAKSQEESAIGVLPIDAIFTPIKRSNFEVEATRVGQVTDFDRLILEIWTDGTITAEDAVKQSASIMMSQLEPIVKLGMPQEEEEEEEEDPGILPVGMAALLIEELKLTSRTQNSLRRGNFIMLGEVLEHSPEELLALRNFGDRSLQELIAKLNELGFPVGQSGTTRGWKKKKFIDLVEPDEEDTVKEEGSNIEEITEVPPTVYSAGADTNDSDIDISQFATRSFAPEDEGDNDEA
tara:strand:- start:1546 stop:2736 length:1191 start_codon:yes stop_codon:yes gene_type:complete